MRINRNLSIGIVLLLSIGMLIVLPNAYALSLKIVDVAAGETFIVDDGGTWDSWDPNNTGAAVDGVVKFSKNTTNFDVVVSVGISTPAIGSPSFPRIHLDNVSVSSIINPGGGGDLEVWVTDTGFTGYSPSIPGFYTDIGGVTDDTVTAESYWGTTAFDTTNTLGSFSNSPFAGTFSDTTSGFATFSSPYSLTIKAVITHSAAAGQSTSFDATLNPVPEPGTMMLLGTGLIGLAAAGRKKIMKMRRPKS